MKVRVSEMAARGFALMRTPEILPVVEYLKARRDEHMETLVHTHDHAQIHRLQGRVQELNDVIGFVETSAELIAKLKRIP